MSRQFRSILTGILLWVALLAIVVPASAGGPVILQGKVVDFSGQAIKKVSVVLISKDDSSIRLTAKSDKDGLFEIAVEDDSLVYEAQFEKSGYVPMSSTIVFSVAESNKRTFTMLTPQEVVEGKADILREREMTPEKQALDLYNEGATAFTAGDNVAAREHFEAALEFNSSMVPALAALSLVAMKQGDWNDAAEYSNRALAIEPNNLTALFTSFRANKSLGNEAEAAAAAETLRSIGEAENVAAQIFNEGVQAYRKRQAKQALMLFEESAEMDPNLANAQVVLAGLYLDKADLEKALAASDRALALGTENKNALKYRFEACLRSDNDQLPEAIEAFSAVDLPYVSNAVNERALNLFKRNLFDQSKRLVELLLALDASDARANYLMGLILVNAGDNGAARTHLQLFVDAAPDDPDAAGARAMLEAIQ